MEFYVGLDRANQAVHFQRAFISINTVRGRKKQVPSQQWILDCGGFTEISTHGRYRYGPEEYGCEINRLAGINPGLIAAVSQDWMCEAAMLERTGLTIADHQRLTIERYDALRAVVEGVYLMPVIQGYSISDYLSHIDQYDGRLPHGAYVGIGSVCKRNGDVRQIEAIVCAVKTKRPDIMMHGFGIKTTALGSGVVRNCLKSADSMAWSYAARKQRNGSQHDWREAQRFIDRIETMPVQYGFIL